MYADLAPSTQESIVSREIYWLLVSFNSMNFESFSNSAFVYTFWLHILVYK